MCLRSTKQHPAMPPVWRRTESTTPAYQAASPSSVPRRLFDSGAATQRSKLCASWTGERGSDMPAASARCAPMAGIAEAGHGVEMRLIAVLGAICALTQAASAEIGDCSAIADAAAQLACYNNEAPPKATRASRSRLPVRAQASGRRKAASRSPPIAPKGSIGPPTRTPPSTPRCEAFAAAARARYAQSSQQQCLHTAKSPGNAGAFNLSGEDLRSARSISVLGDDRLSPVELVVHANQRGLDVQAGRVDGGQHQWCPDLR